jgi:hypothetical protein
MMQPSTIIAGALLFQVLMVFILFVGAQILRGASSKTAWWKGERVYGNLWWELLVLVLVTIGALIFTSTMSNVWGGLFRSTSFSGLSNSTALVTVFAVDIIVAARIVFLTGGSVGSPFQPMFFFIPTVALLLHEPAWRVLGYSAALSAVFVALLGYSVPPPSERPRRTKQALGFVSIAFLFLTVGVGLLTRV